MDDCIFCKVVKGTIPSAKVYEDGNFLSVMDIFPATKGHVVVIPKKHYKNFVEVPADAIEGLFLASQKVAKGVIGATSAQGCRIQTNIERLSGQSIFHVHIHIIPMSEGNMIVQPTNTAGWTPQQNLYKSGEMEQLAQKISKHIH